MRRKVIQNNQPNAGQFQSHYENTLSESIQEQDYFRNHKPPHQDVLHIPTVARNSHDPDYDGLDSGAHSSFPDMNITEPRQPGPAHDHGSAQPDPVVSTRFPPTSSSFYSSSSSLSQFPASHQTQSVPASPSPPPSHTDSFPNSLHSSAFSPPSSSHTSSHPFSHTYSVSSPSPSSPPHFTTPTSQFTQFPEPTPSGTEELGTPIPQDHYPEAREESNPYGHLHTTIKPRSNRITAEEAFNIPKEKGHVWKLRKGGKKTQWRVYADNHKQTGQEQTDGSMNPSSENGMDSQEGIRKRSLPPNDENTPFDNTDGVISSTHHSTDPSHHHVDNVTQYLEDQGFMHVEDPSMEEVLKEKKGYHHDLYHLLPEELRENLSKMLDPGERKQMLGDIYKTKIFIASYWMLAVFFILLFLPDSKFFAPFIAGYIGGRKAGSVWKGMMAAMVPFIVLGLMDILVYYHIIYHFYDLYIPSAGFISNNIAVVLIDFGMDPSGVEGSFYDPGTSLSKSCIYMVISAIIGGTLEGDARKLSRDTAEWVNVSNISNQFSKRKIK